MLSSIASHGLRRHTLREVVVVQRTVHSQDAVPNPRSTAWMRWVGLQRQQNGPQQLTVADRLGKVSVYPQLAASGSIPGYASRCEHHDSDCLGREMVSKAGTEIEAAHLRHVNISEN